MNAQSNYEARTAVAKLNQSRARESRLEVSRAYKPPLPPPPTHSVTLTHPPSLQAELQALRARVRDAEENLHRIPATDHRHHEATIASARNNMSPRVAETNPSCTPRVQNLIGKADTTAMLGKVYT